MTRKILLAAVLLAPWIVVPALMGAGGPAAQLAPPPTLPPPPQPPSWRTAEFDDAFRRIHAAAWGRFEQAIGLQRFAFDATPFLKPPAGMKVPYVQLLAPAALGAPAWEAQMAAQLDAAAAALAAKTAGMGRMGIPPGNRNYDGPDFLTTHDDRRGIALGSQTNLTGKNRTLRLMIMVGK